MKKVVALLLLFSNYSYAAGGFGGGRNCGSFPVSYRISTCAYDANAICSVQWNENEFINEYDHGRQLQSAAQFGTGTPGAWTEGENYNPTEAGGVFDGLVPNPSSSISRYELLQSSSPQLSTGTRMAYWKKVAGEPKSNWYLDKTLSVSLGCRAAKLAFSVMFSATNNERYNKFGQFEVLTAYLKPEFSTFWTIDLKGTQNVSSVLTEGREQKFPVILATPDRKYAMGIYNPNLPQSSFPGDGYGTWRFNENFAPNYNAVKLNSVERHYEPGLLKTFKVYLFIGALDDVIAEMKYQYNSNQLN
jgi:hypothetical protein